MKLKTLNFNRLDSRGVSHIILPLSVIVLLAIGGTFMMVAKNQSKDLSGATTAAKSVAIGEITAKAPGEGTLVLSSPRAQFSAAKILPVNSNSTKPTCKAPKDASGGYVVSFTKDKNGVSKPKHVKCSAIGNAESYHVYYGVKVKGKFSARVGGDYVAVDVDKNTCTVVRPKIPLNTSIVTKAEPVKKKCDATAGMSDAPTPVAIEMRITQPSLTNSKKSIKGYVEIKDASGSSLSQAQCTSGNIVMTVTGKDAKGAAVNTTAKLPLKYVANHNPTYCASNYQINTKSHVACQEYTATAGYAGTEYLLHKATQLTFVQPGTVKNKNGSTTVCSKPA